jgi:hypothetical protein
MRTITKNTDLLAFLAKRVLDHQPSYKTFESVVSLYKKMIDDHGIYGRYPDPLMLDSNLYLSEAQEILLMSIGDVECSKEICLFVREFQGRLCKRQPLTLQDANKLLIKLLKYEDRYLKIQNVYGMNFIESTPECHEALGVEVRVRLRKMDGALIRNRDFYGKFWWETDKKVPLA